MKLSICRIFFLVFLAISGRSSFDLNTTERNLQVTCSPNSPDVSVVLRNLIGSIELRTVQQNTVSVTVIYDILVNRGSLSRFQLGIYDNAFGQIFGVVRTAVQVQGTNIGFLQSTLVQSLNGARSMEVCLSGLVQAGQEVNIQFTFTVVGAVCLHSSGRQALPASWLSDITGTLGVQHLGVDYSLPLGNFGFDEAFLDAPRFTPSSKIVTTEVFDDTGRVFITYNPSSLNFNDFDKFENILFFLPENVFPRGAVAECSEFSENVLFFIILAGVPSCACCCVISIVCVQQVSERRDMRRYRRARRERQERAVREYPGNRDIVLVPGGGTNVVDTGTTVQAILEENDTPGFDAILPTTTINIRDEELDTNQQDVTV